MTPTLLQRCFLGARPLLFLMVVGATACVVWTALSILPTVAISQWNLLWCVVVFPVAACLGAGFGFLLARTFPGVGAVVRWIERRNGAPFSEGDEVVILSKAYRGRVARVREVWPERRAVRLELGETSRKDVTDIFLYTDVYRRRMSGGD